MANKNKPAEKEGGEVLEPKETPTITEIIIEPDNGFHAFPGEYHMIKIDANGKDIPGSDFSIGVRTYNRTYSKLAGQFRVKKSPIAS